MRRLGSVMQAIQRDEPALPLRLASRRPGIAAVVLAALLSCGAAPAGAQDGATELEALVLELVAGARGDDPAAIDDAVCMNWFASAHLLRAEALGVLADATAPEAMAAYRDDYREAVRVALQRSSRGGNVAGVDASDARQYGEGESGERLRTFSLLGDIQQFPITGGGSVQVHWDNDAMPTQIAVTRVGDDWCLNPANP